MIVSVRLSAYLALAMCIGLLVSCSNDAESDSLSDLSDADQRFVSDLKSWDSDMTDEKAVSLIPEAQLLCDEVRADMNNQPVARDYLEQLVAAMVASQPNETESKALGLLSIAFAHYCPDMAPDGE